jgi:tetratricopeptide (TPR) repeat protein
MQWPPIIGFVFAAAATVTVASAADAQSPAEAPREVAARDYREAQRLFEAREYHRALRLFQSAYDAVPNAESLYGMGRCHEELGHHARAAEFYDSLQENHPTYSDRESVEQALADLRAHIADIEGADDASRGAVLGGGGLVHDDSRTDVHLQATRMTRGRKISWGVFASGLAITAIGAGLLIRGAVLYQDFKQTRSRQVDVGDQAEWNRMVGELEEMAPTVENSFKAGWGVTISGLAISCASILLLAFVPGEELIPGGGGPRANVQLSLNGLSFVGSF